SRLAPHVLPSFPTRRSSDLLICCVAPGAAFAQTVGASLQGTVHDPSGAVVPGAEVEIRNVETGAARMLKADESGRWREPVLLPGDRKSTRLNSSHQIISYAV